MNITLSQTMAITTLLILATIAASAEVETSLEPDNLVQFFITPDQQTQLIFRETAAMQADSRQYVVYADDGSRVTEGRTLVTGDAHRVTVTLPRGFWELGILRDDGTVVQRFGIVSLEAFTQKRDPFFCIDAALSWLVDNRKHREDYVTLSSRIGISTIRERVSWASINPSHDQILWEGDPNFDKEFFWQGKQDYDTLRRSVHDAGLNLLEIVYDTPKWIGFCGADAKSGKLPGQLLETVDIWEQIARKWEPCWCGLELWNEPDIDFSGNLPADQYVPFVKAMTWHLKNKGITTPQIGGCLALFNPIWLETAIECGLFDATDGFSFHTYLTAAEVLPLYVDYARTVLTHRPAMPLWLTECGRPWKCGPARPERDEDIASACDIVMKGVEAKAFVIDFYFPFILPFFEESVHNFGMMDKSGSPLRSVAAYAHMIRLLSGYQGSDQTVQSACDLVTGPAIERVRLFHAADEPQNMVAVFYTGKSTKTTTLQIPESCSRIGIRAEGLIGDAIPISPEGTISFSGGLVYLIGQQDNLMTIVKEDSSTAPDWKNEWKRLRAIRSEARQHNDERAKPTPFAVSYLFDNDVVEATSAGYRVKNAAEATIAVRLRLWNFDDIPHELRLTEIGEGDVVTVSPRGFVDQTVQVTLENSVQDNATGERLIRVRFAYQPTDEAAVQMGIAAPCRTQLIFIKPANLEQR